MNKIKILLVFVFPLCIELIISCCNCKDATFLNYTNCNMTMLNLDNSGIKPVITKSNIIPKRAYGIRVSINRSETICNSKKNQSLFIQSTYATSCECPPEFIYRPLDTITSIKIITENDFNKEKLKFSDVTDMFYVFKLSRFIKINEFIKTINADVYDFMDSTFNFDLLLMEPPIIDSKHEFEVIISLSNGKEFKAKTGIITLKE